MVAAEALGVDPGELTDASSPETIASWTSFTHLTLMSSVEEAFGIMLSMEEMTDIKTFGDLARVVRSHVG